jgi:sulfatase modifying factor 1
LIQQGLTDEQLKDLIRRQPGSNAARDWYVSNVQGITMVKIPAGRYAIGDVTDNKNPGEDDQLIEFSAVWMSDRQISVAQFEAMMPELKDNSKQHGATVEMVLLRPVTEVSWFDAIAFCNRLSNQEQLTPYYTLNEATAKREDGHIVEVEVSIIDEKGHGYRLPTEAEWEYACRAMSSKDYSYGDSVALLPRYAVFQSSASETCGRRIPNAWGLFDMHGNVWEWCWDKVDANRNSRVLRGGSFDFVPLNLRSANRVNYAPGSRDYFIGFRISRTP